MSAVGTRLTQAATYVRAHGVKTALELTANFVLPFLIFTYARASLGDVRAMIAASGPPILWSIVSFIRERRLDAISILVLSGILLSLLAFAGGGGVKALQLREHLVGGLVGLIFLGSAAIGRPLIYHLALAGVRRRAPDQVEAVAALGKDAGYRRNMLLATLVWGLGLTALCALNVALVFMLSIRLFLLTSGPIGYVTLGLLTAWTFWSVPHAMRQVGARRAASAPEA